MPPVLAETIRICSVCGQTAEPGSASCTCGNDIFRQFLRCPQCRKLLKDATCPDCSKTGGERFLDRVIAVGTDTLAMTGHLVGYRWHRWKCAGLESSARDALLELGRQMVEARLGSDKQLRQIASLDQRLLGRQESEASRQLLQRERDDLVLQWGESGAARDQPPSPSIQEAHAKARALQDALRQRREKIAHHGQVFAPPWKKRRIRAVIGYTIVGVSFLAIFMLVMFR
jgi:predicted RNA-binding Zn-ribbon protein involved in translation (DUF1610 family)